MTISVFAAGFVLPSLARALTTAALVVSASVAAEALGPFWGALIAALPVSAGPAYVFLAMRHGPDFIAASALASFAANASTGLFLIVYAMLAPRLPRWRALGLALSVWFAATLCLHAIPWTAWRAACLNLTIYGLGCALPLVAAERAEPAMAPKPRRWFEIPLRAVAVAVFVAAVVALSAAIGPAATGMAAVFPVSLISLIVVVRPRLGGAGVAAMAASALRAMIGFGLMLLTLALTARPLGTPGALALAFAAFAAFALALIAWRQRRAAARRLLIRR